MSVGLRKYEESAETITVTGWACKHCRRWWGKDEHLARWCCSDNQPCECGGRREKTYLYCQECRSKADAKKWANKPEHDWDGKSPLYYNDEYFFDEESLVDHLWDGDVSSIENCQIELCDPETGQEFSMVDFLCDILPDGDGSSLDCEEIDKAVNNWIAEHAPFSWSANGKKASRKSLQSIQDALDERGREFAQDAEPTTPSAEEGE